jgi:hypothetical protein
MPYMIVIVSTKTLSARDPAHKASRNPIDITAALPRESTSSRVGSITVFTTSGVSAREDRSSSCSRKPEMVRMSKVPTMKPIVPTRPNSSGGSDRTPKKAASAASPVTR